jgi:hypothetical protein
MATVSSSHRWTFFAPAAAVAHALGWYPELQLANLILAAPSALQIETVTWGMLAYVTLNALVVIDYIVHRRNYRKAWCKVRTKILALFAPVINLARVHADDVIKLPAPVHAAPVIENAPGIVWKWVKRTGCWEAQWRADKFAMTIGYPTRYARLWVGKWPSEFECATIADVARAMEDQMETWLKNWRWHSR